jgi:hypothetical protein
VLALLEERGLPPNAAEFQMLRGMADELKHALVGRGSACGSTCRSGR